MKTLVSFIILILLVVQDRGREANRAYEQGDFERAEQLYRDALQNDPDNARLQFNLGNALARQGKVEDALEAYERFRDQATTPQERALADYNIGNLLAQQEEWQKAAEQFRQSLRNNPVDDDAAHNFELALNQLQQQQEQQQDDQDDQQEDQQDEGGEGGQGQQEDQQEGDESDDGQQDQQPGEPQDGDDQAETRPVPEPNMTQEEAEQILNAMLSREKELIQDFLKDLAEPAGEYEKDW